MATCVYCQKPVDTIATRCPHCTSEIGWMGAPRKSAGSSGGELSNGAIGFAISVGVLVWCLIEGYTWIAGAIALVGLLKWISSLRG